MTEKKFWTKVRAADRPAMIAVLVLAATIAIAFGLPRPKYQSPDIIPTLNIPLELGRWRGTVMEQDLQLTGENYKFISAVAVRKYKNPAGAEVNLIILDAGNFHNPKVCLGAGGFKTVEVADIEYLWKGTVPAVGGLSPSAFTAPAVFFGKGGQGMLVSYWITIDGKRVGWTGQKTREFWSAVTGRKKTGLMVRLDIPASEERLDEAAALARDFVADFRAHLGDREAGYIFGR